MQKVTVVTVVFNDAKHIRQTMESFFSQTWENKEYIVIDGGSTDGTAEIIKEYAPRLAFFCSEKDGGIYDAMNKGTAKASGEWINFLNSGDYYVSNDSIKNAIDSEAAAKADVIYGDSIEVSGIKELLMKASPDTKRLEYSPVFRHGSAFIKTDIQKQYLFDISKASELKYALDWEMLYRVYKDGHAFAKADTVVQAYRSEGVSDHPYLNLWYNYKITSGGKASLGKMIFLAKSIIRRWLKSSFLYRWTKAFFLEFMVNDVLYHTTFWTFRRWYLKRLGAKIGKGTFIHKHCNFINANLVNIGEHSHINQGCTLDARGHITIGDSVSVSHNVAVMTGSHDLHKSNFPGIFEPIVIKDYAWIGINATILQGVTIGRGAVVCAGAVVTKDVDDLSIVAGIPAKVIGRREDNMDYKCNGAYPFT